MSDDSVQFLSNIERTQWVSGWKMQDDVNEMLAQGWALLAAGVNPYGEPTWLLGWNPLTASKNEGLPPLVTDEMVEAAQVAAFRKADELGWAGEVDESTLMGELVEIVDAVLEAAFGVKERT